MNTENNYPQSALYILEEHTHLTLNDLCVSCAIETYQIVELVDFGVLEPTGREQAQWVFDGASLQRARRALRLQHDLDINLAGVALILELLDEMETLHTRLKISGADQHN